MSLDPIIRDTTHRLFGDTVSAALLARSAAGAWPGALWEQLEALGLTTALVPAEAGGAELAPVDALGLVRLAGWHGVPLPLAETLLASWLLASAGLPVPTGPLTLGPVNRHDGVQLRRQADGWRLSGRLSRVPWGRRTVGIAVLAEQSKERSLLCWLEREECDIAAATNLAGEPRDTLTFDVRLDEARVAELPAGFGQTQLLACGAALRASAMAGALERLLEMSVGYANDRTQFGRPIGRFQAIQQNLAVLASQAAAAGAAADIATDAFGLAPELLAIAAAKARAGEAAGGATAIAHQVHGAIGFTEEHPLHFHTKHLLAWRDEFGRESEWHRLVGEHAARQGAEGLWPMIAGV